MDDIQRRVSSLPPDMQELLRRRLAGKASRGEIAARPGGAAPVLSFAQQRLWLLDQLHPGSARYNIPGVIHIAGRCDPAAIRDSLAAIVARHEVLRTVYPADRGQPVQRILPTAELEVPVHDLRGLPAAERAAAAERIGRADAHRPFDLARGPVLRAALVLVEDDRAELHLTVHHIAADGWSLRVLLREFAALHAAGGPALAPLGIQYADFAAWQRGALVGAALDPPLAYWRERLRAIEAAAHLPTDLPRPGRPVFRGALHRWQLPGALTAALRARAAEADATLFMVLLAAFQLVLGRHARGADVAVGTPVAGRGRVELEPLIGLFANTLVLRGDLSGDPSFRELIARTRSRVLEALQHQDLPFEQIVEQLQPDRDPARNPLFQVSFALQPTLSGNEPGAEHGISFELRELEAGLARFDLECHVFERGDGLEVCLIRDTALFRARTADRIAADYHALLAAIADDPARSLSALLAGIGVADGRAWLAGDAALEDIEAALLGHPEIDDAAVLVRRTADGERGERVAYVVSAAPVERLQAELRDLLPRALWPDAVTAVAALPLTGGGEVDAAVLAGLPVLDAATRAAAEAWAQDRFGPAAVVRVRDAELDVPRIHLASLVPELVTAAAPAPARPAPACEPPAPDQPPAISHGGPLAAAADLPRNLAAALDRAADRHPDHGVAYLIDGGAVVRQSYPELRDEAARILAGLGAAGLRPGQPVMFQLDRNQDFVPVFWACMRGGLVAVPLAVPPAYEANAATRKLRAAWELLGRPVVVARDELAAPLRALSGDLAFPGLALLSVEALRRGDAAAARLHDADPDELALLLLTSGSTGVPKAVMQRHRSVLWRSVASAEANGFTAADVSFNWMPLDHVGGVVMFHIRDVCLGAQQVHAPTQTILREPTRWLDEVERHRATITWAPNFAFGLVNEQVERHPERRWDLSALRHILNGGEAVVARTARRFLALLAPHGLPATAMKPAWGMSETSSGVTDAHGFTVAATRDDDPFVEVGAPIPGVSLRIVDGGDRVVPEGTEGRLQIRGETVTAGYYASPTLDRESFTADGWYRTGDLGVLRAGRLTITGREKDVIIVNGVNYYSHEIEAVVEAVPGVEPSFAAACGVREPGRDTDDLAIFVACAASDPAAQQAVAHEIRGQVARSVGVSPRVVLPIPREEFPRTGIGKIQRPQLRARFEAGAFDAVRRALDLREGNERTLPGWFYRPAWRPRRGVARPLAPADTVVFLDGARLGTRLAAALDCTGHTCFRVAAGAALRRTGERSFEVDPGDVAQMSALWPALADAGCTAARVISLVGYDAVPGVRAPAGSRCASRQGTRAMFGLLRSLAAADAPRPAELFVVTRGGLAARADDPLAGDLAPVSGLLASAAHELAWLTCRHVDLGGTSEQDELALWSELELAATDHRVAYRDGVRLVPRLERVDPGDDAAVAPIRIARGGHYLLVGGLGGIGARLAAVLRRVHDARLLIVGRRAEAGWRDALVDAAPELRGAGALDAIEYASLDAADPAALAGAARAAEARAAAPLDGIFHLAGAFAERPLAEETWDGLWEVMRAKVAGGLAVHELLAARPGAFAVHVSSVNGWFGGAGVAAYAAANSFLDGLAHGQRHAGLRSASLAFSMWDEVGMSRGYARRALSRARGYAVLSPEQGLASLLAGLRAGAGHLLIGLDPAARPMRCWLADAPTAAGVDVHAPEEAGAAAGAPPRDRFGVAIPVRRLPLAALPGQAPDAGDAGEPDDLERRLLAVWHEVLGSDRFGVDGNFFELGGHSLLATQLLARINQALGVDLPLSALFVSPTVRGLATAVRDVRPADAARASAPVQLSHDPAGRHEPFPLTDVQQAYWIGRTGHFALGGVGSHEYMELDCPGLDVPRLERAWQHLIERHDMLRAVVLPDGRQQVQPTAPPYELRALDLRGLPGPEVAARLAEVRREMSHRVLPADRCPIFELRASLLDGDRARLHVSIDALIMDAWSFSVLSRELVRRYAEPRAALPALAIQFRDHVVAAAAQRGSEAYRGADAYWRARIASLPPAPALPLARPPSEIAAPRFVRRDGRLSPAAWGAIKRRASRAGVTPSAVLLTAFAEVLGAFSHGPRFTLNLTLFNRPALHPQIHDVVGDFTSLILFEADLGAPAGFEDRARATQARLWADLEHSAVSGIEVLRALARARGGLGGAAMPIVFSSALGMEDERGDTHALERLGEVTYAITQTPQVWLDHGVWEQGGALVFNWDAVDGLFPDGLLDAAFAAYRRLLDALAGDAAWQAASRTAMALPDPLAAPVNPADAPPGTLYSLFAGQAARRPDATAVVTSRRHLTYDELRRASQALGRRLRAAGARPGALVAVVMERGWEQVAAVLGVAASGAAYLPIDAGAPTARRHQLLADARATLVVTQPWLASALAWPADTTVMAVDDAVNGAVNDALALDDGPEPAPVAAPDDLAYVIYTSGSTGQPKGVMIDHRGAVNTLVDINRRFGVTPDDRVLAVSALTFDLSVYDVFGTLAAGAAVVLPDAASGPDPAHWAELVRRHGVTIWNSVPALFQMLVEYAAGRAAGDRAGGSLRLALLSGDWIPVRLPDDARRLIPGLEVVSLGGATEASIWSVLYPIGRVDPAWTSIPYGRAMDHQRIYVLDVDRGLEPCPPGVPGELYIGGIGVARGYRGDPARTAARFVCHPRTGERLYRTGDFGRYLPDGNIEFLGRQDDQIKLNGYRIELGEIEAAIALHPAVAACAAAVAGSGGDRSLAAYVVWRGAGAAEALRAFLVERLPGYMVPASITGLARLPLTANGKVDRRALPPPGPTAAGAIAPAAAEPPGAAVDTGLPPRIARAVAELLELDASPDDDLFALGITSIGVVRLVNRLEHELGHRPRFDDVYRHLTIAGLARLYERGRGGLEPPTAARPPGAARKLPGAPRIDDPEAREAFKRRRVALRPSGGAGVALPPPEPEPFTRRSVRHYAAAPVPFAALGRLLDGLRQLDRDGAGKARYASAGGLYPVQAYLHVQPGRVEGVGGGAYYYHPIEHRLVALAPGAALDPAIHEPLVNRPVFERAALSIFLVLEPRAIEPLYGEWSVHFATVEAGMMSQVLAARAAGCGLGLCDIGWVEPGPVHRILRLSDDCVVLHSLVGGVPAEPGQTAAGPAPGQDWEEGEL